MRRSLPSRCSTALLMRSAEVHGFRKYRRLWSEERSRVKKKPRHSRRYRKAPNRLAFVSQTTKGDSMGSGYDGQTYWISPNDPLGRVAYVGPRLAGNAPIVSEFHVRPYKKMELHKNKKVNNRDAYVIQLTEADGTVWTYYIDVESFLLLRMDSRQGPQVVIFPNGERVVGSTEAFADPTLSTSYYQDWRDVAGIKVPFDIRDDFGVTKILEYQINQEIEDDVFAPPKNSMRFSTGKAKPK